MIYNIFTDSIGTKQMCVKVKRLAYMGTTFRKRICQIPNFFLLQPVQKLPI